MKSNTFHIFASFFCENCNSYKFFEYYHIFLKFIRSKFIIYIRLMGEIYRVGNLALEFDLKLDKALHI